MNTNCKHQDGVAVLYVIMVMMIFLLLGIASLNQTYCEFIISGNDRCYRQNLYMAESVIVEAAQTMSNAKFPVKMLQPDCEKTMQGLFDSSEFNPETDEWSEQFTVVSTVLEESVSRYTIQFDGIAQGSNMDMALQKHKWSYSIYGRSENCNGQLDMVAGFLINY